MPARQAGRTDIAAALRRAGRDHQRPLTVLGLVRRTRTQDHFSKTLAPHRRERGQAELPTWKEEHNASRRTVRVRVERTFARMKTWRILRDRRLKGDGVHHAMLGIARLHNLTLTG